MHGCIRHAAAGEGRRLAAAEHVLWKAVLFTRRSGTHVVTYRFGAFPPPRPSLRGFAMLILQGP